MPGECLESGALIKRTASEDSLAASSETSGEQGVEESKSTRNVRRKTNHSSDTISSNLKSDSYSENTTKFNDKKPAETRRRNSSSIISKSCPTRKSSSRKSTRLTTQKSKNISTLADGGTRPYLNVAGLINDHNGSDLYKKHERELEKCLVRMEKVDHFCYFAGDVPTEFRESYQEIEMGGCNLCTDEYDDENVDQKSGGDSYDSARKFTLGRNRIRFPSTPPYNFNVVRDRMIRGRYVLDRILVEEQKRKNLLSSCEEWKTRQEKISNTEINNNSENLENSIPHVQHTLGVNWDIFQKDVTNMCIGAIERNPSISTKSGTVAHTAQKILDILRSVCESKGKRQILEMEKDDAQYRFMRALNKAGGNKEAAMQGLWRRSAFPERKYHRLDNANIVCDGLNTIDRRSALYELETSLEDSFVGLSYTYDDVGQSEGWMKSVVGETITRKNVSVGGRRRSKSNRIVEESNAGEKIAVEALAADEGVRKAQVCTTMEVLLLSVQDRVMTDLKILQQPEKRSANWVLEDDRKYTTDNGCSDYKHVDFNNENEIFEGGRITTIDKNSQFYQIDDSSLVPEVAEQPVWGIDCYTRRNITLCIEANFDVGIATEFIEKWLLPAINACPIHLAHDISCAARILEGLPPIENEGKDIYREIGCNQSVDDSNILLQKVLTEKIKTHGPPWLKFAAQQLYLTSKALGDTLFRIHPKGHGCVVLSPNGLAANSLVTHYRGEVYPPWRWGEKLDAIESTQQRLDLRPNLPDFYNMALERPRIDPRGYGLLFVDASRKAGLGSSFSHSCDPTCEVKVVAVKGKLSLAITTIRAIERGEELTFDYNAVTESLNEYHAAVCLCGHLKCRGSFLHFATADCYQEVLKRNSPIAVRFSSLVKGCMKKVMSPEDERVLQSHGFGTATFGAVSFNHHRRKIDPNTGASSNALDSIDYVPIWLRTYTADVLRYIEYERRALPIALLCNHFSKEKNDVTQIQERNCNGKAKYKNRKKLKLSDHKCDEGDFNDKNYNTRKIETEIIETNLSDSISCLLDNDNLKQPETGNKVIIVSDSQHALVNEVDVDNRGDSVIPRKQKSIIEGTFDINKVYCEPQFSSDNGRRPFPSSSPNHALKKKKLKRECSNEISASTISFEKADREGWSAMEQRIHQITQTLSRVGRVLDRQRETRFEVNSKTRPDNSESFVDINDSVRSSASFRSLIHSPLNIISDENVVDMLWKRPNSVKNTLISSISKLKWIVPTLVVSLKEIVQKYSSIDTYLDSSKSKSSGSTESKKTSTHNDTQKKISASQARTMVTLAFLEFRTIILESLKQMNGDAENYVLEEGRTKSRSRKDGTKKHFLNKDNTILNINESPALSMHQHSMNKDSTKEQNHSQNPLNMKCLQLNAGPINNCKLALPHSKRMFKLSLIIGGRRLFSKFIDNITPLICPKNDSNCQLQDTIITSKSKISRKKPKESKNEDYDTKRYLSCMSSDRIQGYKLEAAADLLLFYAHTTTFFELKPYRNLESSPIEIYARELGNEVPQSFVEINPYRNDLEKKNVPNNKEGKIKKSDQSSNSNIRKREILKSKDSSKKSKTSNEVICESDDIITKVTVKYTGEYVLSLLLQWYSGGISLKEGLPDMLGCISLPEMSACFLSSESNATEIKHATEYKSKCQPLLKEWLMDRHKRGNPWPKAVAKFFEPNPKSSFSNRIFMMGSPVIDFLITGDDNNIQCILNSLGRDCISTLNVKETKHKSAAERLQSTVDEGLPAQGVSSWVQCENPTCLKWRKLPWHVDKDLLPSKFFCKDNKWDTSCANCDTPEDIWDEHDAPVHDVHTRNSIDEHEFRVGARFDVKRNGKSKFCEGVVLDTDFRSEIKRVKFHFLKVKKEFDEWIEIDSPRIAQHKIYTCKRHAFVDHSQRDSGMLSTQIKTAVDKVKNKNETTKKIRKKITVTTIDETLHPLEENSNNSETLQVYEDPVQLQSDSLCSIIKVSSKELTQEDYKHENRTSSSKSGIKEYDNCIDSCATKLDLLSEDNHHQHLGTLIGTVPHDHLSLKNEEEKVYKTFFDVNGKGQIQDSNPRLELMGINSKLGYYAKSALYFYQASFCTHFHTIYPDLSMKELCSLLTLKFKELSDDMMTFFNQIERKDKETFKMELQSSIRSMTAETRIRKHKGPLSFFRITLLERMKAIFPNTVVSEKEFKSFDADARKPYEYMASFDKHRFDIETTAKFKTLCVGSKDAMKENSKISEISEISKDLSLGFSCAFSKFSSMRQKKFYSKNNGFLSREMWICLSSEFLDLTDEERRLYGEAAKMENLRKKKETCSEKARTKPPTKAKSAFEIFSCVSRRDMQAKHPNLTPEELAENISAKFKCLSDELKMLHEQMAEYDLLRFEREVMNFSETRDSGSKDTCSTYEQKNKKKRKQGDNHDLDVKLAEKISKGESQSINHEYAKEVQMVNCLKKGEEESLKNYNENKIKGKDCKSRALCANSELVDHLSLPSPKDGIIGRYSSRKNLGYHESIFEKRSNSLELNQSCSGERCVFEMNNDRIQDLHVSTYPSSSNFNVKGESCWDNMTQSETPLKSNIHITPNFNDHASLKCDILKRNNSPKTTNKSYLNLNQLSFFDGNDNLNCVFPRQNVFNGNLSKGLTEAVQITDQILQESSNQHDSIETNFVHSNSSQIDKSHTKLVLMSYESNDAKRFEENEADEIIIPSVNFFRGIPQNNKQKLADSGNHVGMNQKRSYDIQHEAYTSMPKETLYACYQHALNQMDNMDCEHRPKKIPSSFDFYVKHKRKEITEKNPKILQSHGLSHLLESFKHLCDSERKKFDDLALEELEKH